MVLSTMADSGARITATNPAAEALGLFAGMPVADARAIYPPLVVEAADPEGDMEALRRLTLWAQNYSPLTRIEAPDGIAIDITGCAHLFGGETAMAEHLADKLCGFGLNARIAIAPTIGAGWALCRYGPNDIEIVAQGEISERIAALPVEGVRLETKVIENLEKVGLKQIGLLVGKPRAALTVRFGPDCVRRLDQALGLEDETFGPLTPPPFYQAACRFTEPVTALPFIEEVVQHLAMELAEVLFRAGKGARRIVLGLYRVDGRVETLEIRTSRLSREAGHLAKLLIEQLDRITDSAGFGFEAAALSGFDVEGADTVQNDIDGRADRTAQDLAALIDRLANRFGAHRVARFMPHQSYIPERAAGKIPMLDPADRAKPGDSAAPRQDGAAFVRPLLMLEPPEPITVLVEMPDKPPARFEWRHMSHHVTRADGPERIAPEWWRGGKANRKTRDYYRVEDEAGHRFWLYRDGLYERAGDNPEWFIHGVFA